MLLSGLLGIHIDVWYDFSGTMTPDDIFDGTLRIALLIALCRPTEFLEINFQHQVWKS
jgi:hypothetical protein